MTKRLAVVPNEHMEGYYTVRIDGHVFGLAHRLKPLPVPKTL